MKSIKPPPNFTLIHQTQPVPKSQRQSNSKLSLLQDVSGIFCCGSVIDSTSNLTFDSVDLILKVKSPMSILQFSSEAKQTIAELKVSDQKKLRKVQKTLGLMEVNLRHPGLKTHKYESYFGPNGEDIFEAYVENSTSGAFRVFWYYGPDKGVITISAITPHP